MTAGTDARHPPQSRCQLSTRSTSPGGSLTRTGAPLSHASAAADPGNSGMAVPTSPALPGGSGVPRAGAPAPDAGVNGAPSCVPEPAGAAAAHEATAREIETAHTARTSVGFIGSSRVLPDAGPARKAPCVAAHRARSALSAAR